MYVRHIFSVFVYKLCCSNSWNTVRFFFFSSTDQPIESLQPPKSRRKDGYLSDEEDPARKALRQEEQATRAARQIYFLRQQVRSLQEVVTRKGSGSVKHTKKVRW